ncbi:MAG: non-homologous end-joining DNA ligase [Chloroflexota bacterium]
MARRTPLTVSHPERVIYEAAGVTKGDVVAHYQRVAPRMLDFMAGRPLTLQRFPRGIGAPGFMQKNAAGHFPASIGRYAVPKQDGGTTTYPVVTDAEDVAYLANQGTLTFHMWLSRTDAPERPDWLVLDLDPEDGDVAGARHATAAMRDLLAEFDVAAFPVATGSKGFHVWVPLAPGPGDQDVATVARALAELAAIRDPERLTVEFLKRERRGRVFVDWLRNTPGATVVVPFSLRPTAVASVAVPLTWDELATAQPAGWRIGAIDDRLTVATDLAPQRLPVDAIVAAAREAGADLETTVDRFGRRTERGPR